jgi:hypothetical protein
MIYRKKCVMCGEIYAGFGNNPYPIKMRGRCCDACNTQVTLARLGPVGTECVEDEEVRS